jgi:hypothetical protein
MITSQSEPKGAQKARSLIERGAGAPTDRRGHHSISRTYLVFGDIEGSSTYTASNAPKCDRNGRYHLHKLIEKYGRMGNLMELARDAKRRLPECGMLPGCHSREAATWCAPTCRKFYSADEPIGANG